MPFRDPMGLIEKIVNTLRERLDAEYIRLDDDEGISGFIVSRRFENLSGLDRQRMIDETLRNAADPLSKEELRQIIMIAALTPLEYESVGVPVTIHSIEELPDGSLEVLVDGSDSDAVYARGALNKEKDVQTTEPEPSPRALGILMTFRAKGSDANPLTKSRAIAILSSNPYIRVMQSVG